jgi:hypothetical protein
MAQKQAMIPNPDPTKADAKITALRRFKAGKIELSECLNILEHLEQEGVEPSAGKSLAELAESDDMEGYAARRQKSWAKGGK